MTLAVWPRDLIQDFAGNVVSGADVVIRRVDNDQLAQLYIDRAGLTLAEMPLVTNGQGRVADANGARPLFLSAGLHKLTATLGADVLVEPAVPVGTMQEYDYPLDAEQIVWPGGNYGGIVAANAADAVVEALATADVNLEVYNGATEIVTSAGRLVFGDYLTATDLGGGIVEIVGTPGGTSTDGISSLVQTDVTITAAGTIPRSARQVSSAEGVGKITSVDLDLATAGRVDLPIAAVKDERIAVYRVPDSAEPTIDIEGDTDDTTGVFGVDKPIVVPPSGRIVFRLVSINPTTGLRNWEIESGAAQGRDQYLHGSLEGVAVDGVPPQLRGFNPLMPISRTVSGNTEVTWDDLGKIIKVTGAATITIPANSAAAFPEGCAVAVLVKTASTVALAITTDTLDPQEGSTLIAAGNNSLIGAVKEGTTAWQALGRFASA